MREPLKFSDEVRVNRIESGKSPIRNVNDVEVELTGRRSDYVYAGKINSMVLGMKPEDVRPTDMFRITIERIDGERLPLPTAERGPHNV